MLLDMWVYEELPRRKKHREKSTGVKKMPSLKKLRLAALAELKTKPRPASAMCSHEDCGERFPLWFIRYRVQGVGESELPFCLIHHSRRTPEATNYDNWSKSPASRSVGWKVPTTARSKKRAKHTDGEARSK